MMAESRVRWLSAFFLKKITVYVICIDLITNLCRHFEKNNTGNKY